MNINYKQSQFELFSAKKAEEQRKKPRAVALNFDLSLENLVIFIILSIIALLFSFLMGVHRGKRLAHQDIEKGVTQTAAAEVKNEQRTASLTKQEPVTKIAKIEMPGVLGVDVSNASVEAEAVPVKTQASHQTDLPYTIQVASFQTRKYANQEADTLRGKGYEAFVLKKGSYSIVCVGRYKNKVEARQAAVPLKQRYADFLIRRM